MNVLIRRLVRDAVAPIGEMEARLFKQGVRLLFVVSCLFAAAIFLTIAFYLFVETLAGPVVAALSVGALYLGVAIISIAVSIHSDESRQHRQPADSETMDDRSAPRPEFAAKIDSALAPVLDLLGDAGFQRERLAVEAGAAIVKKLDPLTLVALSVVAGVILSRALGSSRPSGDGAPSASDESAV